MNKSEAEVLLKQKIQNKNLIKHSLAVAAIMQGLAVNFKQNAEDWYLAGLLHDLDYETTKDNPAEHSLQSAAFLAELGFSEEICQAVKVHNEIHNVPRLSLMDKALYAADPLSGMITAAALILPSKKLNDLSSESIAKRMDETRFAASVNREAIKSIEQTGLPVNQFMELGLAAMKKICDVLGL